MRLMVSLVISQLFFGSVICQSVDSELAILHSKSSSIFPIGTFSGGEWSSLDQVLVDKRIAAIGEFTHGTKEITLVQLDLIKYLHETHGFNVLLTECGIGEMFAVNQKKKTLNPQEMAQGLMGPWMNKEHAEMMQYVKSSNMQLCGYDVQRTGNGFSELLIDFLDSIGIESNPFINIEQRYGDAASQLRRGGYEELHPSVNTLIKDYQNLLDVIPDSKSSEFYKKTIQNRISYLEYRLKFSKTKDYRADRFHPRDSLMALNVSWLLNKYPGEKIMLIGHNFHLSKYNEQEEVLGEYLDSRDVFFIGIFARSGVYANNSRVPESLTPPDSTQLDIKDIIQSLPPGVNLIHEIRSTPLFDRQVIVNDSFVNLSGNNYLVPSKHFDGLILMDVVSPAEYR